MFEHTRRRVVPASGLVGEVKTAQTPLGGRTRTRQQALRGAELRRAVAALDASADASQRAALAAWIAEEYRLDIGSTPIGFVAACHLGPPYVDHYLNLLGQIVEHFAASSAMPHPFEAGRMLARVSSYEYVEVHSDGTLVPVKVDGSPVPHTSPSA